jgi:Zn-dependent protease with chaperone function
MSKKLSTTERRENFEQLVKEAEQLLATRPKAYRTKVAFLAVLGYLMIFGLLALLIGILGGSIWIAIATHSAAIFLIKSKLFIILPILIWVILKSLWVSMPAPSGYKLEKKDFPLLFQEIEQLTKQLDTVKIHQILLTDEFNAGVAQVPRLGIFGWHKNILLLGLPLLLGLSTEQARAVLGHEFGHLSGNHCRFNAWIYRIRKTWYQIAVELERTNSTLIGSFFNWYVPYFEAYSFALARVNEYEADAIAAKMSGSKAIAQALLAVDMYHNLIGQHYWQGLYNGNNPESPYSGLAQFFYQPPLSREEISTSIQLICATKTNHDDTHPALKDRLAALQETPDFLESLEQSAAQIWFGEKYTHVLADFDQAWLNYNGDALKEQLAYQQKIKQELSDLQAKPSSDLTQEEQLQIAYLTVQLQGELAALELYKTYVQQYPNDLDAQLYTGRLKLLANDVSGFEHLTTAMQRFSLVLPACQEAYSYYERIGDEQKALAWRERGEHQIDLQDKAYAERNSIQNNDVLLPCDLTEEEIADLRQQLLQQKDIKKAWICKKQLEIAPDEEPIYVLAYQRSGFFGDEAKLTEKMIKELLFKYSTFLVMKGGSSNAIAKKVIKTGQLLF